MLTTLGHQRGYLCENAQLAGPSVSQLPLVGGSQGAILMTATDKQVSRQLL